MHSKKGFVIPLIIAIVAILAIGGVVFVTQKKEAKAPVIINPISTTTPIVGGDRDAHGCIGSAGYSWCAVKNKCLRVWEEKCEVAATSTNPVACTMDAMMCPDGTYVGRSGPNCEFKCLDSTKENVLCEGLDEESCSTNSKCRNIYGPSFCDDSTCTTDLVFKSCFNK
jgi:hypothetical protein